MAVGGTVSGTLTFDNGDPVADSSIRLVSKKNPQYFRTYMTDGNGCFQTAALGQGQFDVELSYAPIWTFIQSRIEKYDVAMVKELVAELGYSAGPAGGFDYLKLDELEITAGETKQYFKNITITLENCLNSLKKNSTD